MTIEPNVPEIDITPKKGGRISRPSFFYFMVAWLLAGCVATPVPVAPVANDAISGLRATLENETERYYREGIAQVRWRTEWVLRWQPTPQATGYVLAYKTSEGVSKKPVALVDPVFRIEVAKGDNPEAAGFVSREIQLLTIQSLLSVRVAAHFTGGTLGTPSPWVLVGAEH